MIFLLLKEINYRIFLNLSIHYVKAKKGFNVKKSIDNSGCLESYSMHNFSFILFRSMNREFLMLKFAFYHFERNRREPP